MWEGSFNMRETGIGTGIILIATGAVLAFAVNVRSTAIDLNAIGAILMVVGIIGVLLSFVVLGDFAPYRSRRYRDDYIADDYDRGATPPHEHRRVDTHDVVYDEDGHERVERIRRTQL